MGNSIELEIPLETETAKDISERMKLTEDEIWKLSRNSEKNGFPVLCISTGKRPRYRYIWKDVLKWFESQRKINEFE